MSDRIPLGGTGRPDGRGGAFRRKSNARRSPFLVELLAQERGRWKFESPVGQELAHPGRVGLYAAGAGIADRVGLLLENPEFPGDRSRAEWKEITPEPDGSGFLIREPNFSMRLRLQPGKGGEIPAELSEIRLGPAPAGRWNFTGLYLRVGGSYRPLEFTGPNGSFKLQTGRVGSVFKAGEPVELIAVRRVPAPRRATLILRDYYSGAELSRRPVELAGPGREASGGARPVRQFRGGAADCGRMLREAAADPDSGAGKGRARKIVYGHQRFSAAALVLQLSASALRGGPESAGSGRGCTGRTPGRCRSPSAAGSIPPPSMRC